MGIENQILIRRALAEDASQISDLIIRTGLEFQGEDMTDEGKLFLLEWITPLTIWEYLCSDSYLYLVAERLGIIVGVIAIKENRHLFHLFVAREYHGCGIARKLWEAVRDESSLLGNKGHFTVFSSSYALEFYKKMGFAPTGNAIWKDGIRSTPMEWKFRAGA